MFTSCSRRSFLYSTGFAAAALTLGAGQSGAQAPGLTLPAGEASDASRPGGRPNVLFIVVDDLRPELGCYGHRMIKSPNIDRLAADGATFTRAYCQQAVCAPSRMSVLSGLRPDSFGVYNLATPFRDVRPDTITLPQHFKQNGYTTLSISKVYHHGTDDPQGWTQKPRSAGGMYANPDTLAWQKARHEEALAKGLKDMALRNYSRGPATEEADVPDNAYHDGAAADTAIASLQALKRDGTPFFMALGLVKPHLPFCAPSKYWQMYDRNAIALPDPTPPRGAPAMAFSDWGELRAYRDIPKQGDLDEALTRKLIHGYYASVSYTDAQVGRVVAELERLGLRDNTIIVIWGDHGWKLGEYADWCKHTNFEYDTHAPLLLSAPGQPRGIRRDNPVEFIDIYPTLCALAGLETPTHCEGSSVTPLLGDASAKWKDIAVSQYPRGKDIMGYTLRHRDWRYTEWVQGKELKTIARELYDHSAGPHARENLAEAPQHAQRVQELSGKLRPFMRVKF